MILLYSLFLYLLFYDGAYDYWVFALNFTLSLITLVLIEIPIYKQNHFKAYKISRRFDDDISSVCASFNFLIKKNIILKANVAYGGMSEIPKRASIIEKALTNSVFSEDTFSKAKNLIDKDFSPIDDMRASKNYRIDVAKNLMMKFFFEVSRQKNLRVNL